MKSYKAKLNRTGEIVEGSIISGFLYINEDHDILQRYSQDEYEVIDEPRSDDEMISIIQQLITTARDAHSNPSLAKQYQDALEWFNKKVGR